MSILVHRHRPGGGGIGDMFRSMFSFYSFAVRNNLEFYIDLSRNEKLDKCFDYKKFNPQEKNAKKIFLMDGIYCSNSTLDLFDDNIKNNKNIQNILDEIINEKRVYIIYSNACGFEKNEYINNVLDKFFNDIITPSFIVVERIRDIKKLNNLTDRKYTSIHLRSGDYNMGSKGSGDK